MSTTRTTRRYAAHIICIVALLSVAACANDTLTGVNQQAALSRGSSSASTASSAIRVEIALTAPVGAPFRSAKGKAKFAAKSGERELQIEAENIPAGTSVVFTLGGAAIGTGTADVLRSVRLNLNATLGASVPTSVAGKSVTVATAAGVVIVAGSF